MASITITLSNVCSGGGHLTFSVTGDRTATLHAEAANLLSPIDNDEIEAFVKGVIRLARAGRTNAQVRTLLQNGLVVTV